MKGHRACSVILKTGWKNRRTRVLHPEIIYNSLFYKSVPTTLYLKFRYTFIHYTPPILILRNIIYIGNAYTYISIHWEHKCKKGDLQKSGSIYTLMHVEYLYAPKSLCRWYIDPLRSNHGAFGGL